MEREPTRAGHGDVLECEASRLGEEFKVVKCELILLSHELARNADFWRELGLFVRLAEGLNRKTGAKKICQGAKFVTLLETLPGFIVAR